MAHCISLNKVCTTALARLGGAMHDVTPMCARTRFAVLEFMHLCTWGTITELSSSCVSLKIVLSTETARTSASGLLTVPGRG